MEDFKVLSEERDKVELMVDFMVQFEEGDQGKDRHWCIFKLRYVGA